MSQAAVCEPILRSLPEWFGIEQATRQYIKDINGLPTFVALVDGQTVGFLTLKQHSTYAAEIHVMGVRPHMHRSGIGQLLIDKAEEYLEQQGIEYLQVKTLSSTHPDKNYARTRKFYLAVGFRPLEEFLDLWGKENPCLQMIKALQARPGQ